MTSLDLEEQRIRDEYARRKAAVPPDRYSVFQPAMLVTLQELERCFLGFLDRAGYAHLADKKILEVGCGHGYWLRQFVQWGAVPENLAGIDLIAERIERARATCPPGITLLTGNAARLDLPDAGFDLVVQCVVFTSILDPGTKKQVAAEMLRVLRPGGAVLWYDFRVDNPWNTNVRGVKQAEVRHLFPGCRISIRRVTLAPPLARVVAPVSPALYHLLSRLKFLCTHFVAWIEKP